MITYRFTTEAGETLNPLTLSYVVMQLKDLGYTGRIGFADVERATIGLESDISDEHRKYLADHLPYPVLVKKVLDS
ncbi:MAG: hypothetical protein NT120_04220 [Candidatus Aenigmarchaeota archaeon]|nr:hypothetical protein [Candidatus Aenigmarchaeota archaeon]